MRMKMRTRTKQIEEEKKPKNIKSSFDCSPCGARCCWLCFFFIREKNFFRFIRSKSSFALDQMAPYCSYVFIYVYTYLVRFINYVTFNICETWAKSQFQCKSNLFLAPCGLCFSCTNICSSVFFSISYFFPSFVGFFFPDYSGSLGLLLIKRLFHKSHLILTLFNVIIG